MYWKNKISQEHKLSRDIIENIIETYEKGKEDNNFEHHDFIKTMFNKISARIEYGEISNIIF